MKLNQSNLVSSREKTYFFVLGTFAALGWLILTISIFGLVYALIFGVFIWFANGLFVARIRSNSVEATPQQFPELYRIFAEVAKKVDQSPLPRLYVLQAEGAVNAFATRHTGRDFVVVFSSLYEALGANTDEMKFLLGHEIGHVKRKHISKFLFLCTGAWIPLLGAAYRRAVEETCDRFGTFAAGNTAAAARAMTILSCGKDPGREADVALFARQYESERGFFVSWNELISSYPTLSQRTHHILSSTHEEYPEKASRNPLAWVFAFLFCRQTVFVALFFIYGAIIVSSLGAAVAKAKQQQAAKAAQARQQQQQNYDERD